MNDRQSNLLGTLVVAAGAMWPLASPATAHPHILASVHAEIIYSDKGILTGIRQSWNYDPAYSAFAMRQIDTNGDGQATDGELSAYANTQVGALAEFGYFTNLMAGGVNIVFAEPKDYTMRRDSDGRLTLSFVLPLKQPTKITAELTVEVFDPNFFAYFTTPAEGAVRFIGAPPSCEATVSSPAPLDLKNTRSVPKLFWAALDGSKDAGRQFVNRITVTCP